MEPWTIKYFEDNPRYCLDELKKEDVWHKIPLINSTHSHDLKEGQLVRFYGMIQDMFDPVYYLALYEVLDTLRNTSTVRSGKYKDCLQCAEHERILYDSEKTVNQDRIPMYCISVPAVNQWAHYIKCASRGKKSVSTDQDSVSSIKRKVDDDVEMVDCGSSTREDDSGDVSKRLCSADPVSETVNARTTSVPVAVANLNLPVSSSLAEACIINFYDISEGQLKINDVVEVAGFLSYESADVTSTFGEQLPPPSLVPRLHAITFRPVQTSNPLISPSSNITIDDVMTNAPKLRNDLKLVLTQLLLGDTLAADYMICHLLSHIYLRQDMMVLGKFSLNLSKMPQSVPNYTIRLYDFLKELLVKSHFLPMTLHNMNTITMIPKKNYENNRLESGMLQLSDKTHLVIDETQLEPGELNDKGVRNITALGSVISHQSLKYDFQFYPVEFNTDIPVLILSEGKSILPSDFHLPVEADGDCLPTIEEVFTAASHFIKEPLLSQLRVYISLAATADYDLSPAVQQIVQEDFVRMRREDQKTTAQDLHSLLVLAKLLSLSQGSRSLTRDCWEIAQQMEHQRKRRILST